MKKLKSFIISFISSVAIIAILISVTAVIISQIQILPREILPVITTAIGCIGIFLGTFIGSVYLKEKGMLIGAVNSIIIIAIVALISYVILDSPISIGSVGKMLAWFFSGTLGGILGVNKKSKIKF